MRNVNGTYYIGSTEWARKSRDYKGTKLVNGVRVRTCLVNLGGRGTGLTEVTLVKDDDPRLTQGEDA